MIIATAGVAIGLGNIWRFPYMMMDYGGAAFLLVYLVIVFLIGIPALMAEWALGRHTRHGPMGAFAAVRMPGSSLISGVLLVTIFMACSYYGVILAQVLASAFEYSRHLVIARDAPVFDASKIGFWHTISFVAITAFLCCGALMFGVKRGIERLSMIALPVFFLMFVILIIRVLTLPGAMAALTDYLKPNMKAFQPTTFLAALGQAFFSMGLGGTLMVTYGSYMRREDAIPKAAVVTAMTDMLAAIMAGMIVIPAALALKVNLGGGGPNLFFVVMPQVFEVMPSGTLFSSIFFLSVFIVALLSLMAGYEVIVIAANQKLGLSRRTTLGLIFVTQILMAIPALKIGSYIQYSDLIWGSTMHPVGCAFAVIAFAWCLNRATALKAISPGSELPFKNLLIVWLRYVIPVTIIVIIVGGWWPTVSSWLSGG